MKYKHRKTGTKFQYRGKIYQIVQKRGLDVDKDGSLMSFYSCSCKDNDGALLTERQVNSAIEKYGIKS